MTKEEQRERALYVIPVELETVIEWWLYCLEVTVALALIMRMTVHLPLLLSLPLTYTDMHTEICVIFGLMQCILTACLKDEVGGGWWGGGCCVQ